MPWLQRFGNQLEVSLLNTRRVESSDTFNRSQAVTQPKWRAHNILVTSANIASDNARGCHRKKVRTHARKVRPPLLLRAASGS